MLFWPTSGMVQTAAGEDECPGQFNGWRRGVAGVNDRNAAFFRRFDIDRGVAECCRRNETKPRQPLYDGTRDGRPLSHHADNIELDRHLRARF
jgi:hypothetical protein